MNDRDKLIVKDDIIYCTHIGLTLRTLLATAAEANLLTGGRRRRWRLSYKEVIIGSIRIVNDRDMT